MRNTSREGGREGGVCAMLRHRSKLTAKAPEFRTQNRSPALPRKNALPEVAPYRHTLPAQRVQQDRVGAMVDCKKVRQESNTAWL